jgi:hypothetical protein
MRRKLPSSLERRVLVKNRHCCCICQSDGYGKDVLIHHIDGNNSHDIESNLAVLCLVHASQADAGLQKGKLGSGKKLKPEAVRQYKKMWEKKIELGLQYRREILPAREKKQLELLYKFEICKHKNLILSFRDGDKRIKEAFNYLDHLVLEEFISGIDIRSVLLDAYSDISVFTMDDVELPKRLAKSLLELFPHIMGPAMMYMNAKDKKIFSECLKIFETTGTWAGEGNGGIPVLREVCKHMFEFARIASWNDLVNEKKNLLVIFSKIHNACANFEITSSVCKAKREINNRQAVVRKYWDKSKQLFE